MEKQDRRLFTSVLVLVEIDFRFFVLNSLLNPLFKQFPPICFAFFVIENILLFCIAVAVNDKNLTSIKTKMTEISEFQDTIRSTDNNTNIKTEGLNLIRQLHTGEEKEKRKKNETR